MVDFQSRDTSRGFDDEDSPDDDSPAEDGHDEGHDHGEGDHSHDEDDHHAHDVESLGAAVVTVSSSRSLSDDPSGDAVVAALEDAGHTVVSRDLVNDDRDGVQGSLDALVRRDDVDIVVTTGGTGVTPDDVTVEAISPLFEKELPGFGELFRSLSFEEIGTKIVGTRATAGVADGVPVFCLPGSENAARLGTEEIIVEEAGHLAGLASRE
ncbi:MogA/MoaB family molybdenum cofactor biosynthesis protein [Halorussus amylolyticus]|uniref:MogA/MoaB family molybdenum cofactor biosynthesis protein n=1 Tax=Halorussus amylolyticus TaxID=1126242 RepID=UPI001048A158|nr:molybdenum cofactor biosynthesis protein B [Halorussus amylolyticus]